MSHTFSQVPRCRYGELRHPTAPAIRDWPAFCWSQIPKSTSGGNLIPAGFNTNSDTAQRRRLICSEEKRQWLEVKAGEQMHSPRASPLHGLCMAGFHLLQTSSLCPAWIYSPHSWHFNCYSKTEIKIRTQGPLLTSCRVEEGVFVVYND